MLNETFVLYIEVAYRPDDRWANWHDPNPESATQTWETAVTQLPEIYIYMCMLPGLKVNPAYVYIVLHYHSTIS